MRSPGLPRHYLVALALVLTVSAFAVWLTRGQTRTSGLVPETAPAWSWHFFFLGAGFMLLETKSIVQFALLWGSTWSSASLAIASVLVMALASALVVSRFTIHRRMSDRRRAAGPHRAELRDSGRPDHLRQPRGRIFVLRRARLQPGVLRRPAVQHELRGVVLGRQPTSGPICSARWSAAWANISRCSRAINFC